MIEELRRLPAAERVRAYNQISSALGSLVEDLVDAPALSPQLLPAEQVRANDYNPNRVASVELGLLEQSIRADGITMPVVVVQDAPGGPWTVVDGFHRRLVVTGPLKGSWVPCSVISPARGDRIASTVRHNRARGKHQVDLMGELVRLLMAEGWGDPQIADRLGMSVEELLRLKQIVGAAKLLSAPEYTRFIGDESAP